MAVRICSQVWRSKLKRVPADLPPTPPGEWREDQWPRCGVLITMSDRQDLSQGRDSYLNAPPHLCKAWLTRRKCPPFTDLCLRTHTSQFHYNSPAILYSRPFDKSPCTSPTDLMQECTRFPVSATSYWAPIESGQWCKMRLSYDTHSLRRLK